MDAATLTPPSPPALLDARAAAALLTCSPRPLLRLAETGRCPAPVRLGHLVRWRRDELLTWLAEGCPTTPVAGGNR